VQAIGVANDGDWGVQSGIHGNANGALMGVVILVNVNSDTTYPCKSNTATFVLLLRPYLSSHHHDTII